MAQEPGRDNTAAVAAAQEQTITHAVLVDPHFEKQPEFKLGGLSLSSP